MSSSRHRKRAQLRKEIPSAFAPPHFGGPVSQCLSRAEPRAKVLDHRRDMRPPQDVIHALPAHPQRPDDRAGREGDGLLHGHLRLHDGPVAVPGRPRQLPGHRTAARILSGRPGQRGAVGSLRPARGDVMASGMAGQREREGPHRGGYAWLWPGRWNRACPGGSRYSHDGTEPGSLHSTPSPRLSQPVPCRPRRLAVQVPVGCAPDRDELRSTATTHPNPNRFRRPMLHPPELRARVSIIAI